MKKFCKICQIALIMHNDVKNKIDKKINSSKLVNELLKFELKIRWTNN